jgi:hypothetical protein
MTCMSSDHWKFRWWMLKKGCCKRMMTAPWGTWRQAERHLAVKIDYQRWHSALPFLGIGFRLGKHNGCMGTKALQSDDFRGETVDCLQQLSSYGWKMLCATVSNLYLIAQLTMKFRTGRRKQGNI